VQWTQSARLRRLDKLRYSLVITNQ